MEPGTVRIILAWALTQFGYRAAVIALPLVALQATGSTWSVGLVAGAAGIPILGAPWWTPPWQRRLRTSSALSAMLGAQAVATLVVPLCAVGGVLDPLVMSLAGLAIGSLNALSGPLASALLAGLGDRHDPAYGAARVLAYQDTGVRVAMTLAPWATLPLIGWLGAPATATLEGLLSLVAAAVVAGLRITTQSETRTTTRVRGLLSQHPDVAAGWLIRGSGCVAWFAFTLGLAVLGVEQGRGALLATVGLSAYSAGAILGSVGGIAAARSTRPASVNAGSWALAGVGWLVMAWLPRPVPIAMAAFVMGLAVPAGNAAVAALVTRATTGIERRAALTAQSTVVIGCSTLGALLGGFVIAMVGPRAAIAGAGAGVLAIALAVMAFAPAPCRNPSPAANVPT